MRISDWSSDVGSSDLAGVAGGVAHVVVDAGVDDDGGAVAVEQLIVDCQVGVEHFDGQLAGGRHVDVGHVAGVRAALGIEPVLGVGRVVVAAGGGEGRIAEAGGVHAEAMGAFRHTDRTTGGSGKTV